MGAESGSTFPVSNPMTGSVLGQVPDMRAGDTEAAVTAASEAFTTWQNTTAKERSVFKSFYHFDIVNCFLHSFLEPINLTGFPKSNLVIMLGLICCGPGITFV